MLDAFGMSDPGCVRTNNEDYFISHPEAGIFILADGMGGAKAGEYASQLSAERLYEFLLNAGRVEDGDQVFERGFAEANWVVRQTAKSNPEFEGMGTTLLAVRAIADREVQVGSVGDSRAYLCSAGQLSLITRDQTWVAEVGPQLGLTPETLKQHPMRHVLTMAVGCAESLRVSTTEISLTPGDQILLCSDGLHGVVEESVIAGALNSEKTLQDKCHYLVEAAKGSGGPDNVTVLLIQQV